MLITPWQHRQRSYIAHIFMTQKHCFSVLKLKKNTYSKRNIHESITIGILSKLYICFNVVFVIKTNVVLMWYSCSKVRIIDREIKGWVTFKKIIMPKRTFSRFSSSKKIGFACGFPAFYKNCWTDIHGVFSKSIILQGILTLPTNASCVRRSKYGAKFLCDSSDDGEIPLIFMGDG